MARTFQQTFSYRESRKFYIRNLAQTFFGTNPYVSLAIFMQARHVIARQPVGFPHKTESTILEASDAGPARSHPQHSIPIHEQRAHFVINVWDRNLPKTRIVTTEPKRRANPNPALPVFCNCKDD